MPFLSKPCQKFLVPGIPISLVIWVSRGSLRAGSLSVLFTRVSWRWKSSRREEWGEQRRHFSSAHSSRRLAGGCCAAAKIVHRRPKLTIREIDRLNDLCKRMSDDRVGRDYLKCAVLCYNLGRWKFERSIRLCMEFKITSNKSARRNKICTHLS